MSCEIHGLTDVLKISSGRLGGSLLTTTFVFKVGLRECLLGFLLALFFFFVSSGFLAFVASLAFEVGFGEADTGVEGPVEFATEADMSKSAKSKKKKKKV